MNLRKLAVCMWLLAGCSQESKPATAIVVTVKTDFAIETALASVEYRVFPVDANPQTEQPAAKASSPAAQLQRPFVVEKNHDEEVLIAVQGLSPSREPIVELRVRARFQAGQTIEVPVFLGQVCARKECSDPRAPTCHGDMRHDVVPGTCGPIPVEDAAIVLTELDQHGKWMPKLDGGVAPLPDRPEPPDVCMLAPDAGVCDPVAKCGCPSGQSCRVTLEGKPVCEVASTKSLPNQTACRTADECAEGHGCRFGYCSPFCSDHEDCAGGSCIQGESQYGECVSACKSASDCPAAFACSRLNLGKQSVSLCWNPRDCTNSKRDAECDEPDVGTGLCLAGTDGSDCTCNPAKRGGCDSNQTCQLNLGEGGSWTSGCLTAGTVSRGGVCSAHSDCASGLGCVGKLCVQYCSAGTTCPGGSACDELIVISTRAPLFPPIGICNITCRTNTDCVSGATCKLSTSGGMGVCSAN